MMSRTTLLMQAHHYNDSNLAHAITRSTEVHSPRADQGAHRALNKTAIRCEHWHGLRRPSEPEYSAASECDIPMYIDWPSVHDARQLHLGAHATQHEYDTSM